MATATILSKEKQKTNDIKSTSFPISKLSDKGNPISSFKEVVYGKASKVASKNSFTSKVSENNRSADIIGVLPFRISFTNIVVPGYSYPNNVAPLGIAIIGFNNYIL
jgi:hypothetical protein